MPGKKAFDAELAALDALREAPHETRVVPLRKALAHRNNFLASRAADMAREFHLIVLTPDLLAAFDRFFENPEKSDPQCWAKNAISRALASFEHQEPEPFLRGMRHIQLEPVWGGRSDTAGTLRSTCAFALVQCRTLSEAELLTHLIDLAADTDKSVRAETMRAIEQLRSPAAAQLLRMRAVLGHDEPEVLGACYSGILHIEGLKALPWVGRFLSKADDASAEAALAIAATHSPEALALLRNEFDRAADPWFRSVLLSAIGLTREVAARDFLLEILGQHSVDAEAALQSLFRSWTSPSLLQQLEEQVADSPRLSRSLAELRRSSSEPPDPQTPTK